jgi:transcriptional regulator with XRE-family HTH domain
MTMAVDFGREIRRRREAQRMTLEQLAASAGLTPNYIGTIENGKRDPSLSTILALAAGLQVPPAELLGGLKELSPAAMEAALLFDGTPQEVRDPILRILRATSRRRSLPSIFSGEQTSVRRAS